ncbi:MAG: hypothetical protein GJV46_11530 [Geobacter sp.]|nr:hypothetical protein [Geobacter sp.]
MKNALIIMIILQMLTGCAFVGVGAIGEAEKITSDQSLYKKGEYHAFGYCMLKSDYTWKSKPIDNSTRFTINDVRAEWGEPLKVENLGEKTVLHYSDGLRWKGVVLIALLPIPLAVPVGSKTVQFEFTNGMLDRWKINGTHIIFSYAGFNLIPVIPVGLFAETDSIWSAGMTVDDGNMNCNVSFYKGCYLPKDKKK